MVFGGLLLSATPAHRRALIRPEWQAACSEYDDRHVVMRSHTGTATLCSITTIPTHWSQVQVQERVTKCWNKMSGVGI